MVVVFAKPTMGGKDRSLLGIVARTGLLAFIAVFVVLMPEVSSAMVFPESNNLTLVLEYYNMARRLYLSCLSISGIKIVYTLTRMNKKSVMRV